MAIAAELKARVSDPNHVRHLLAQRSDEEVAIYSDTYFDQPDGELASADRELRVREIRTASGIKALLTYKGAAVDAGSGSKPETETQVADAAAMRGVLAALGFVVLVAFEKHCFNYRFERDGRAMLATIVRVPQIDGTFIELETIVDDERDVASALDAVRSVLRELGISSSDETTDTYTDAVMAARA